MNKLEQIRSMTKVVADTGDIESIRRHTPVDATTNPSLLLKAAHLPRYKDLVEDAVAYGKGQSGDVEQQKRHMLDKLAVNFGMEILKIVPGRVSTEVDARQSFDTDATVRHAENLIELYAANGVESDRVLIKIASTWEGIEAGEVLERRGIHCNMTLMFSYAQAIVCADAGVTLISPFVGRIFDWYKKAEGVDGYPPADDPGVQSVRRIYSYYKKYDYPTVVMGASFRNTDQILELAGCDLLTISPELMAALAAMTGTVERKLEPGAAKNMPIAREAVDEKRFRWEMNEDAMATEKLAEGIRGFTADTLKLERFAGEACTGCP